MAVLMSPRYERVTAPFSTCSRARRWISLMSVRNGVAFGSGMWCSLLLAPAATPSVCAGRRFIKPARERMSAARERRRPPFDRPHRPCQTRRPMLSTGFMQLARAMIAADTVSKNGTRGAADVLQGLWEHAGLEVRRQVVDDIHVNLLA